MPTTSRLQIWFALYAISTLISMATMSIGAVLLVIAFFIFRCPPKSPPRLKGHKNSLKSSGLFLFDSFKKEFQTEWDRPLSRLYFKLSLGLTITCLISLVGGSLFPLGYGGKSVAVHWFKDIPKLWYLFWPGLLVTGLRRLNPREHENIVVAWLSAFAILSLIGIFQYFTGWPRMQPIPGEPGHFHATLFLGHHLSVASIFIFPLFACLDFAKSKKSWIFYVFAILGTITLFLSYSRTLWIALPIGLFCWILWNLPKGWGKRLALPLLFGFLIGIFILLQYPPIQNRIYARIGIQAREELWLAQLEFFKERPLTGVGWRHNQELSGYYLMNKNQTNHVFSGHAHNNFLDLLGGTGLFGVFAWLAWCGGVFWILFQKTSQSGSKNLPHSIHFSKGFICAWLVFQINGLTQVNFWEGKVEHQVAWMIAWALL